MDAPVEASALIPEGPRRRLVRTPEEKSGRISSPDNRNLGRAHVSPCSRPFLFVELCTFGTLR